MFTEEDLFLQTERVIARAYANGDIFIRFKIEGEQGYSETLDWLNNLLEKKYADINDGYAITVRFLIKPMFIKQLSFPSTTCHAFFARAVTYPALREKVKQYTELALKLFDWYKDLDGEENCVPGTFAACALAFAEEKYVPMIGLFGRNSDDEHQYIQLEVASPLFKQYGATPEVAAALYDIESSNGQDGDIYLNKALLTTPACLVGVMEHIQQGDLGSWAPTHLEYHVPGYVERIWGDNVKSNLKKFKQFADGATTPEDRNAFTDFYNFYKKYAATRDKKDYGEDLEGIAENNIDIVVPFYDAKPLLSLAEAEAANWQIETEYTDKRGFFFFPACIDDPELLDFVLEQWRTGCAQAKEISETFSCGEISSNSFGKWVFNTAMTEFDWGLVLSDGKNKPHVLYGIMNVSQLAAKYTKHPFKTPEEAETARQKALLHEAPEKIPLTTPEEFDLNKKLSNIITAIFNKYWFMSSQLVLRFKPEDGRFYDASLLLRAEIMLQMGELDKAAAVYDEVSTRRPEFAAYMANKKAALGNKKSD
jgi:hypothetical protein